MHVNAGPNVHRPEGAGGNPHMHVGAGPDAHRSEGAGGDP